MIDEQGRPEKDVSHEGSRWLQLPEIERILSVGKEALGLDRPRPTTPGPGEAVRLQMASLDADGSGMLEGSELARAGGKTVDLDGDGRVTLEELARAARAADASDGETSTAPPPTPAVASAFSRTQPDGDLARLLDGVDPYRHDRDQDGKLTRAEAEHAFFDALDLDDDQELSRDELSRYPGPLRDLRFGDARALEAFGRVDRNHDGKVSLREFHLADEEWKALDQDGDGSLRLVKPPFAFQRARGLVLPGSEWPARRSDIVLLPPGIDVAAILAAFDRNGDEVLDVRELSARPDLMSSLDGNGDQHVDRSEMEKVIERLEAEGVQRLPDDFLGRWDLDGSGTVEPDELPEAVRARLRTH